MMMITQSSLSCVRLSNLSVYLSNFSVDAILLHLPDSCKNKYMNKQMLLLSNICNTGVRERRNGHKMSRSNKHALQTYQIHRYIHVLHICWITSLCQTTNKRQKTCEFDERNEQFITKVDYALTKEDRSRAAVMAMLRIWGQRVKVTVAVSG